MITLPSPTLASVAGLYLSAEHVYVGHFGKPSGKTPMCPVERAELRAGRGIVGDRYFLRPSGGKGQVSFFAEETWFRLAEALAEPTRGPEVFRRNILTRHLDLMALIGREFEVQGVRFRGTEHCKPCFWMDEAFAPGAFATLTTWQAGGLRAEVLSDGVLSCA